MFDSSTHPRDGNQANRGEFSPARHQEPDSGSLSLEQAVTIDAHGAAIVPWKGSGRGGTIEDRMLTEVEVSVPPMIANYVPAVPQAISAELDQALQSIVSLDATHGPHLASLSALLLRAESVASSKIERVEASVDDYARALHGMRSNSSAVSMVASTKALDQLIRSVDDGADVTLDQITKAHGILMKDDPEERLYAGKIRTMQNWIQGSDYSPRGASHVPPVPDSVPAYMADLVAFTNRDDLNAIVQATVVHAQFESIHPFTDGNGRIGRALINTVLRRRGATKQVVVPLASAIVARRDDYFDALGEYRAGDVTPLLRAFALGTTIAAKESATTADRLATMPDEWDAMASRASRPRAGSTPRRLLDRLIDDPIFSADEAAMSLGGSTSSVYAAIARLHDAGVLRPLTNRTRNQVWVAASVADELNDLGLRIAYRAKSEVRL